MAVAFPDSGSYDRARKGVRKSLFTGPASLGRRRKSRPPGGGGVWIGRAAEDIEANGTGSVDLIDGGFEETGASIEAMNRHKQFRIEAGSELGGVTMFGVHLIWWVDRCPDDVVAPPERCYCAPPYGGPSDELIEYDCDAGYPTECSGGELDYGTELCECNSLSTGEPISYNCSEPAPVKCSHL